MGRDVVVAGEKEGRELREDGMGAGEGGRGGVSGAGVSRPRTPAPTDWSCTPGRWPPPGA